MKSSHYWLLVIIGTFCVSCLWKTLSPFWPSSSVRAKASIQLDLSLPSSPNFVSHRLFNRTIKRFSNISRRKHHGAVSKYMLQLYQRRPDADIVRALLPIHVSGPGIDGGRILAFSIPSVDPEETLVAAELLGTVGTILRVRSFDEKLRGRGLSVLKSRRDDTWRAFNVTSVVTTRNDDIVRLHVRGTIRYHPRGDGPILLLSYSKLKKKKRHRRSTSEQEDQEENSARWEEDGSRRRRRNGCRRRPLYVDFSLIAYDEWVVAPPGYEAYQCAGKCFYPFGDHLSPTKHAIVQTLVHGALQNADGAINKPVGRACCVPTRLAPTSLLYLDDSGTLTYQYGYEDMVVAECGCR